jgi:DNA repair protein RecO (recombination protein O)
LLHKTRGIVFHVTAYSESSVVAKIYTELYGLQSYLINGVRNKKSKIKSGILQPLSLLEMVVYHKEKGGLQRIKEIRQSASGGPFNSIPFDVMKSSMVLFMNEVLYKAVKEEEANPQLFDFIFHAMQLLDLEARTNPDFHLHFLVKLTKYLGFFPNGLYSESTPVFNLQEGTFGVNEPVHPYYISSPLSMYFDKLVNSSLNDSVDMDISISQKRELIEKLLEYYALHITGFGNIHSNKVLEEVWS